MVCPPLAAVLSRHRGQPKAHVLRLAMTFESVNVALLSMAGARPARNVLLS